MSALRKDAEELLRLSNLTESQNVKRILMTEANKMQQVAENEEKLQASSQQNSSVAVTSSTRAFPTSKLYNYGWDQSEKFVKIYVTFNGVENYPSSNVSTQFNEKSFELQIIDDSKKLNFVLAISNLLNNIKPGESYHKVKTDMVIVFLKKGNSQNWSFITETEKKAKDSKAPKFDKEEDPSAGLMTLMKQMYQDGDDDMKRTIAKAWTEARDKQSPEEMM